MSRIFLIAGLIFSVILPLHSQNLEKDINQIREWFREVNSIISESNKVMLSEIEVNQGESSEPFSSEAAKIYRLGKIKMTRYFVDEQLVKMTIEFYGDREDLTSEYYFKNGNLFFVDKINTVYHRPKWHDEFKASQKSKTKDRFYVKEDRVIRWSTPDLESVGAMDPAFVENESMIANDYKQYIKIK
ncbi:hypothetical protein D770_04305 [Flammeovirgaceae bacterium 311]|nr:hypothetical protein D770_04305 [Flammeovirgaceae bacterium 311]